MRNIQEAILVDSECINDAVYNNVSNRLTLTYKNGGIYSYENVPAFYWHGLFNSYSKGKFINKNIIGKWSYNRVN